ncbi:MAG TPA: AAA domain-containing protein [Actinomadura sp.]|jgi:superfamily I DNA and/or RNA helicase|nr:AAA domain-containing protein [Actinomadura sp.]
MVYGTAARPFPGRSAHPYSPSCWIDVAPDGETRGKWVPAEGAALARVLEKLHRETGVELSRIRVLSPFRDVVNGCRGAVRELHWDRGRDSAEYGREVASFIGEQIGTVHTMQGKEADVVILVLGTDPKRGGRARSWAAESPNLLNVAVSRAKRRLFVIGNLQEWRKEPFFDVMADALPSHRWVARASR